MKQYLFLFLLFLVMTTSCENDKRTGMPGLAGCRMCGGRGYTLKEEYLGLRTTYYDCMNCKIVYESIINGSHGSGPNTEFKAGPSRKGACHYCGSDVCPRFIEKSGHPSTCGVCGCDIGSHYFY